MLEKPPIADEEIARSLHTHYGLAPSVLEFLPLGYDSAAWVYRVTCADSQRYFLKVRRGGIHSTAPSLAHYLRQQGMEWVVAPLATVSDLLVAPLDGQADYSLLLYPWLDGHTGKPVEGGLTDEQWVMYGGIVRQLHATRLPAELANGLPVENFVLRHNWGNFIRELGATIEQRTNPIEREFTALWDDHLHEILHIVEQAEFTGNFLRGQSMDFVVCHADIHTANLLATQDGRLHVVDWDRPLLAPKERDLMFAVGTGVASTREESLFLDGYGSAQTDALAMAYYCFEWCVQEFADFARRVFVLDDTGHETKTDSVRGFQQLFDPGDVVEQAHQAARMAWLE